MSWKVFSPLLVLRRVCIELVFFTKCLALFVRETCLHPRKKWSQITCVWFESAHIQFLISDYFCQPQNDLLLWYMGSIALYYILSKYERRVEWVRTVYQAWLWISFSILGVQNMHCDCGKTPQRLIRKYVLMFLLSNGCYK